MSVVDYMETKAMRGAIHSVLCSGKREADVMKFEIPEEIVRALERRVPADQVESVVRRSLAIGLYKVDELPLEKAAKLARVDEATMQEMVEKAWQK